MHTAESTGDRVPTRTGAGASETDPVPTLAGTDLEAGRRSARNLGRVYAYLGDRVSTRFQRANVTSVRGYGTFAEMARSRPESTAGEAIAFPCRLQLALTTACTLKLLCILF